MEGETPEEGGLAAATRARQDESGNLRDDLQRGKIGERRRLHVGPELAQTLGRAVLVGEVGEKRYGVRDRDGRRARARAKGEQGLRRQRRDEGAAVVARGTGAAMVAQARHAKSAATSGSWNRWTSMA